jgi:hypothetical protein
LLKLFLYFLTLWYRSKMMLMHVKAIIILMTIFSIFLTLWLPYVHRWAQQMFRVVPMLLESVPCCREHLSVVHVTRCVATWVLWPCCGSTATGTYGSIKPYVSEGSEYMRWVPILLNNKD